MNDMMHRMCDEFPNDAEKISALKQSNAYFARLFARYNEINRAAHRAMATIESVDDHYLREMRRQRMQLKVAISGYL